MSVCIVYAVVSVALLGYALYEPPPQRR